ncbi:hypothetical protein RhiirA4_503510 [Rhizophagus irregularis]|uniref:RDRP C-terminal head domain-containing protein n=1 Tax=Rhizophagus irregularis TaxID=588596 RepID=A0A2I1H8G7_9GLOM|nr:hypothetical protein RhiirA4_503510 [Rhizophagus irregularis]
MGFAWAEASNAGTCPEHSDIHFYSQNVIDTYHKTASKLISIRQTLKISNNIAWRLINELVLLKHLTLFFHKVKAHFDFPNTDAPPVFSPELRAREFPGFMEESDKKSYESQKVLSILYRSINVSEEHAPQTNLNVDQRLYVDGYEEFLDDARKLKREYDASIRGLMNQFRIMTEIEVISGYIVNTITKVNKKRLRDV